jgi:hypothetical protein
MLIHITVFDMAYCSNCGAEMAEGAAFCSECGEAISAESDPETQTDTTTPETSGESIEEPEEPEVPEEDEGIQWARVGMAVGFALIPAFIAYIGLSLASGGDPVGIIFFLSLPIFGYLLYQRPTAKTMTGGMCYYLAIEFLLSPFVFLLYTFAFASENTATTAGQAGAAIGGFALTVGAFVIGLPLAIALYLVSRRLDPS